MIRQLTAALSILVLAACASSMTREYAGRPVSEVIRHLGSPDNIFDGTDGNRRFQWSTTDVVVSSAPEGGYNDGYWTAYSPLDEGGSSGRYCTITIIGRWEATGNNWIVMKALGPFEPPRGRCGMR
jgi:hypothetical protein